jgi:hypothetical protein
MKQPSPKHFDPFSGLIPSESNSDIVRIREIKHNGKLNQRKALLRETGVIQLIGEPGKPRKLTELIRPESDLLIGELRVEIDWILLVLESHSNLLASYTSERETVDLSLRLGQLHVARRQLLQMTKRFGWTLSILERWINTHLRLREDSKVTLLVQEILSSDADPIQKFVTAALTYRHSSVIPSDYYRRLADSNVKLVKTDSVTRSYLRILIGSATCADTDSPVACSHLLYYLGTLSAIDQYEIFLRIVLRAKAFFDDPRLRQSLSLGLSLLCKRIDDYQLQWIVGSKAPRHSPVRIFTRDNNNSEPRDSRFEHGDGEELFKTAFWHQNTSDVLYLSVSDWILRQPTSVYTEVITAVIDVFSGAQDSKILDNLICRFDTPARQLMTNREEADSIQRFDARNASAMLHELQLFALIRALRAFLQHEVAPSPLGQLAEKIVNFRQLAAPIFPILASNADLVGEFSKQPLTSVDDLPILLAFSFLSRSQMETSIRIEEYLGTIALTQPSKLINYLPSKWRHLFPIFAIDLCTLEQLEHLPLVGSKEEDIIKERITLLRQVAEFPECDKTSVQSEITQLVKLERLKSMARIMDASRLLVDVSSIEEKVKSFFESGDALAMSKEGEFSDLHQIYLGVFLLDEEHGLDAELSNRIRHGKLRERLLKPFIANSLVSDNLETLIAREPFSSNGITNGDNTIENLKLLRAFAESIRNQINYFGNERAQLRVIDLSWKGFPGLLTAKTAPNGLICVTRLKDESYLTLKSELELLDNKEDLDIILQECTESIWKALESQLQEVRDVITGELFDSLAEILNQFEREMSSVVPGMNHEAFARCRSQLGSACEEVASWFVRPVQTTLPTSRFDDIAELAQHAVETSGWGPFEIVMNENLAAYMIDSKLVGEFYDILVLIFSNAGKHGAKSEKCQIRFDLHPGGELAISNMGSESIDADIAEAQRLLDLAMQGANREALNREGKSGMSKLVRQLRRIDRRREVNITVCETHGYFTVRFTCGTLSNLK